MLAIRAPLVCALAALALTACAADASPPVRSDEGEVTVDTRSPEARRQYDANVAFALSYSPRCAPGTPGRPRALVTGFGRFLGITNNATGRIVSTLVPEARYPETEPPPRGEVDPPEAQLSVGTRTLTLPDAGEVDVCAMILPVYWDLAAILIAKEVEAFRPDFVLMNGVAGRTQPIWIELGAINRASGLEDGSSRLRPALERGQHRAPIVADAAPEDEARPNLLSWNAVASAASEAIAAHADDLELGARFGDLLPGVKLAGFPRTSNTYLCNNVTYVTGYLMGHPERSVRLLRSNAPLPDRPNWVDVQLAEDLRHVPRVFVHWPSALADRHHAGGAEVMRAILDAQLVALRDGEPPLLGDNAMADPALQGGDTF